MSIKVLTNSLRSAGCEAARNRHDDGVSVQRLRLLMQLVVGEGFQYVGFVNFGTASLFAVIARWPLKTRLTAKALSHCPRATPPIPRGVDVTPVVTKFDGQFG